MTKVRPFRYWFYLRQGYAIYFTFIFASINVLTVTYFLAIENFPGLKELFPSFVNYVGTAIIIGIPVLILVGYIHFRRVPAYKSEMEVGVQSNPYNYKLAPGWQHDANFPSILIQNKFLLKLARNEKITEEDIKEMSEVQEKIQHLLKGGYLGDYRHTSDFKDNK